MTTPRLIHEGTPDEAVVMPVAHYKQLRKQLKALNVYAKRNGTGTLRNRLGFLNPLLPPLGSLRTGREPEGDRDE